MNNDLINRPEYLQELEQWQEQKDLIKIVTGIRRCGKSTLLKLFQNKLVNNKLADESQIISINLEDELQIQKLGLVTDTENFYTNYTTLLDYILAHINKDKMNYVFIDEIQLLRNWHKVANTLRLQTNIDVYLTGSNAYMFSKDLANVLGGRYVEIKMQPLSFKEYFSYYQKIASKKDITDINKNNPFAIQFPNILTSSPLFSLQDIYTHYITESGFPQTLSMMYNHQHITDYLQTTVYQNTIYKDIIKRFNIKYTNKLDAVARYMFDNIGNETSIRNIANNLKDYKISVQTINDTCIQGMLDSFLLYKCEHYDIKGKQYLEGNAKYYVADIGLRTAILGLKDMDAGHILENVVYLELLRRGYEVSVGKIYKNNKKIEIDFVAKKSAGIVEYYQVALSVLTDATVLKREITPLQAIEDNYPKFLLTMDYGNSDNNGIQRINVFDWLLQ